MSFTLGRSLLTVVGIVTSTGCYIADWSVTHVFNPNWPPHAKFHNGQTMTMGLLLGLCTIYYTHRTSVAAPSGASTAAHVQKRRNDLNTASLFGALYWITQLSAWFYPGALPTDPEFGDGFPQLWISLALFSLIAIGYRSESAKIKVALKQAKVQ